MLSEIRRHPESVLEPSGLSPGYEAERLAALRRYDFSDAVIDLVLNRIVSMASRLAKTPIGFISLVDADRVWFKAQHGFELDQIERRPGLCATAILTSKPHIIVDARADARAMAHPLVAGTVGMRFYAGIPLVTSDGYRVGTLTVADRVARQLNEPEVGLLQDLAALAINQLELRQSQSRAVAQISEVMAEKERALERAELMKQETDHRIMNSLQLVSSLLLLQSRSVSSEEAAEHLRSASSRVSTVAQVHRHFYLDASVQNVPCVTYLRNLCAGLSQMLRLSDLTVEGEDIEIPAKQIVPIGLIVNEFVTNAAKYGEGRITVSLQRLADTGFMLSVVDQGPGLAQGFDPRRKSGLGMKVVRVLAQQLGGRLSVGPGEDGRGARFSITVAE
ncbi:sensor histidine kinase [Rhodoligotrophos defluvii]|uniref:sensor histidine kinase n=1 Tax=Rhodoligotrophos defluvii TaxID=2561934 RepID=UPI0014856DCD|nr:histidine kinase dimerization/phosphoacceptor domain -containing protein [Rhodoligotrophos defluvii]